MSETTRESAPLTLVEAFHLVPGDKLLYLGDALHPRTFVSRAGEWLDLKCHARATGCYKDYVPTGETLDRLRPEIRIGSWKWAIKMMREGKFVINIGGTQGPSLFGAMYRCMEDGILYSAYWPQGKWIPTHVTLSDPAWPEDGWCTYDLQQARPVHESARQELLSGPLKDIRNAADRAISKHRPINGPHECFGVLYEEFNKELADAMHANDDAQFKAELLDIAAVCLRYLEGK